MSDTPLAPGSFILNASTGDEAADELIRNVVQQFETRFPTRVRAYYLIGSYADGSAVPLSDMDMIVVFKDDLDGTELQAAQRVCETLVAANPIRLDITPRGENAIETMYAVIRVGLKQASLCVYGEDIRDALTLPPFEVYTKDVIAGALFFIARLHDTEKVETLPLTYPDSQDPFFGYTRKRFVEWYPPEIQAGTKEFVATMSRIATATVALKTGKYVGGKRQGIRLYQEYVGEPWGPFVAAVYHLCKRDWGYHVPEGAAERAELSGLCEKMLAFENNFCALVESKIYG